jgi:signal transduction histidine kinase
VLFGLGLALGLGALLWITALALSAGRREAEGRRRAIQAERVRTALAQADAALAPFLDAEAMRPWEHYATFHEDRGALVPSPMLILDDPLALLRFQVDPEGRFSSPLVPEPSRRTLASRFVTDPARLDQATVRLEAFRGRLGRSAFLEALARAGAVLLTREDLRRLASRARGSSPFRVEPSSLKGFWVGGDLVLARQIWVGDRALIQGLWVDWDLLKEGLLGAVRGILPQAEFVPQASGPARGPRAGEPLRQLPVLLLAGPLPPRDPPLGGAALAALAFAWGCACVGGLAGAAVLLRAMRLAQSREAVTGALAHELRTPLTTFRLYTELLAFDMVPAEGERRTLLATLLTEADRLDHLVRNVLAYARLEGRRGLNPAPTVLGVLLEGIQERLEKRAAQGGMVLEARLPPGLREIPLRTDAVAVEQILFNLVDNACKYGRPGEPIVRLEAEALPGRVRLRVRDQGPGIPPAELGILFRPFHKPSRESARRAPGLGLGLALSRRLARNLGGNLACEPGGPGACFVLELPVDTHLPGPAAK